MKSRRYTRNKRTKRKTKKMRGGNRLGMWLMLAGVLIALIIGELRVSPPPSDPNTAAAAQETFDGTKPQSKITLVISDTHGARGFKKTFEKTGVMKMIDGKCSWNPNTIIDDVISTGDYVDRGDDDVLGCMVDFKKSADLLGKKVHLGAGNHEALLMQGDFRYVHPADAADNYKGAKATAAALRQAVIDGHLKVALLSDEILYSHAGFTPQFLDLMSKDKDFNTFSGEPITDANIIKYLVPYLNQKFQRDVAESNPNKPVRFTGLMYEAGLRGDGRLPGGPLWADKKEHVYPKGKSKALELELQLTGHNTQEDETIGVVGNNVVLADTGHHRKNEAAMIQVTHVLSRDGRTYSPIGAELQIMTPRGLQTVQVLNFTKHEDNSGWTVVKRKNKR